MIIKHLEASCWFLMFFFKLNSAGWEGPPPPRGCEVFVGKIPRDMYEDELVPLFERAGKLYEFRLMMEFTGENRGYAFVMYTNK